MSKETLQELDTAINDAEAGTKVLKRMRAKLMTAMVNEQLNNATSAERRCCGNLPRRLAFGYWECPKSPIGICVYNSNMDRAHDECLFCDEPEQRT